MILFCTLSVISHLISGNMAVELESDLQDTMDWGRKWLVDFIAGKPQLVLFDQSNNIGWSDLEKK